MAVQTQNPFSNEQQPGKSAATTFFIIILVLVGFMLITTEFMGSGDKKTDENATSDNTKDNDSEKDAQFEDDENADSPSKDNSDGTIGKPDKTDKPDDKIENTDKPQTNKDETSKLLFPWQKISPEKPFKKTILKNDEFNTEKFEIVFSERGASIAELWLKGYPGGGKNHKEISEDEKQRLPYLKTYTKDKITGSIQLAIDKLDLEKDFLTTAQWEFAGHKVVNREIYKPSEQELFSYELRNLSEEAENTTEEAKTHEVTFVYPPKDVRDSWEKANNKTFPMQITKIFRYVEGQYIIEVDLRVKNNTDELISVKDFMVWGFVGLRTSFAQGAMQEDEAVIKIGKEELEWEALKTFYNEYSEMNKDRRRQKNLSVDVLAKYSRTGLRLNYFGGFTGHFEAVMMHPKVSSESLEVTDGKIEIFPVDDDFLEPDVNRLMPAFGFKFKGFKIEPKEEINLDMPMFVGPKKPDYMPGALHETMKYSYGWLNWLGKILFNILSFFKGFVDSIGIGGAWGIAIILLTFLVRIMLLPLSYKAQVSMQESQANMKKIQPKIKKIEAKFGVGKKQLTREQKMKLNQEKMQLWRTEGVGMGGMMKGCFIMLLQMPIWIALFGVFRYSTDLYGASFLWISDLTKPDALFQIMDSAPPIPLIGGMLAGTGVWFFNLLPFFSIGLMWYQSKVSQNMQPQVDPEQAKRQKTTMGCMYIMFFFLFYSFASGFNLYFLSSAAFGLLETKLIRTKVMAKIQKKNPEGQAEIKVIKKSK